MNPDRQGKFVPRSTFHNNVLDLNGDAWITFPQRGSWVSLDVRVTYDPARNQSVRSLPNTCSGVNSDACPEGRFDPLMPGFSL